MNPALDPAVARPVLDFMDAAAFGFIVGIVAGLAVVGWMHRAEADA